MDVFSLCLKALSLTAQSGLHLFFSGRFMGRQPKSWHFFVYLAALWCIDGAAAGLRAGEDAAIFAMLAVLYGVDRGLLGGGRALSCNAAVLAVYVTELSGGLVNSVEALTFPGLAGSRLLKGALLLAVLAACALGLLICQGILRIGAPKEGSGPAAWILAPSGLFFLVMERYILRTAYDGAILSYRVGMDVSLLTVQMLSLAALFASLLAYRHTCGEFQTRRELASLAQAVSAQRTYVSQAKTRYEQTRSFRHDINSHLTVLSGLLAKGSPREAQAYLEKLKISAGELSFPYHSGNPVVDILLEDKLALAKAAGAEVRVSLALPREELDADLDFCVIFSNALDNAIRACGACEGGGWIRILGKRQGDFYLLEFENACESPEPVRLGTGLSNIRTVAEKYGGTMTVGKTSGSFCLSVLLNLSARQEGRS